MSVRLRRLPNGILTAPKRGRPPPIPDGYEIYNNDPFIFALILPKCKYREYQEPSTRCCYNARSMYCKFYQKRIVRRSCVDCDETTS